MAQISSVASINCRIARAPFGHGGSTATQIRGRRFRLAHEPGAVATHAVEEYSKHAEECQKLADLTAKPEDKRVFEDLAQAWKRLADLRKNEVELETKPLTFLGLCSQLWSHMWSHTSKH